MYAVNSSLLIHTDKKLTRNKSVCVFDLCGKQEYKD